MQKFRLSPVKTLEGSIKLPGSKSLSNRALMLCSLAGVPPSEWLSELSAAQDTVIMQRLLTNLGAGHYDAGDAGTAFRFMAARLAIVPGSHVLTGSVRMQERPIGALVEGLRQLGVNIDWLGKEGYPPLRIQGLAAKEISAHTVSLSGNVSSQFISALMFIAPLLPNGLRIEVTEPKVSWSYVRMTAALMQHWGVAVAEDERGLTIAHAEYQPSKTVIEPDWSAASYWCSAAALSQSADLLLEDLQPVNSLQGDAAIVRHYEKLGVVFTQTPEGVRLTKMKGHTLPRTLTIDFTLMPDMAQTLAVTCAALGVTGVFGGLSTLAHKETDRLKALKSELAKLEVGFVKLPAYMSKSGTQFMLEGIAKVPDALEVQTYADHRMAMAFAALAFCGKAFYLDDAAVVRKSYPGFWEDWSRVCK